MEYNAPILLAEDDEGDIFFMRRAFRKAGLSNPLTVVRNGQEAIWYLNGQGVYADRKQYPWPCLFLLDLKMPVVDGFEVLAWLQRRRRPKDLMVVIVSSSQLDDDVMRALELGADSYLTKPQDFNQLVEMICELGNRLHGLPQVPSWLTPPRREYRL
jgi:CheY-like chemotaxis protein